MGQAKVIYSGNIQIRDQDVGRIDIPAEGSNSFRAATFPFTGCDPGLFSGPFLYVGPDHHMARLGDRNCPPGGRYG